MQPILKHLARLATMTFASDPIVDNEVPNNLKLYHLLKLGLLFIIVYLEWAGVIVVILSIWLYMCVCVCLIPF